MRIGSIFSGIGGLELGLERAGVGHTVWQVEIDPFCRQVLAKHWPNADRYEDVTTIDWAHVEPVEVLCGGFPCQDISLAGRGAGLAGERSGLWREYLRAIRELRPRYVVVENVAALLARGLGDVLGDLAESGYDAEWDCIPAAAVGAPHRRDRLFLLAYPNADGGRLEVGQELDGQPIEDPTDRHPRRRHADRLRDEVANAESEGLEGAGVSGRPPVSGSQVANAEITDAREGATHAVEPETSQLPRERRSRGGPRDDWWSAEPDVGRVADGVPSRVDRLRALGNAVVPQVAEVVGRRLLELEAA